MEALLPRTRSAPAHRSDERDLAIQDSVIRALRDSGYRALGAVTCRVERGVVELTGVVSKFYFKQLAQEAALRIADVSQVRNRVKVV